MTPYLHPRSRVTTSLFGTTLLVSFLVVGMPHILPCPAPRVKFTESDYYILEDGRKVRRRRPSSADGLSPEGLDDEVSLITEKAENMQRRKAHECPVPKPRGIIGDLLGFKTEETYEKPPRPRIESGKGSRSKQEDK
ncbi:hypothetical protein ACLMJK_003290 [Lecanora helva]